MTQVLDETLTPAAATSGVAGLLGAGALSLAALGILGVVSFSVRQRLREFGIRLALGAAPADILSHVLRRGMRWTAAGLALGLSLSGALAGGLRTWLGQLSPALIGSALAGPLLMAAVALLACYLPARRASKVDPMEILRHE